MVVKPDVNLKVNLFILQILGVSFIFDHHFVICCGWAQANHSSLRPRVEYSLDTSSPVCQKLTHSHTLTPEVSLERTTNQRLHVLNCGRKHKHTKRTCRPSVTPGNRTSDLVRSTLLIVFPLNG